MNVKKVRGLTPSMRIRDRLVKIISTFFYIGYLPVMPGTFGSIAAAFIFYLTKGGPSMYILLALALFGGMFISGKAEALYNKKDTDCIVIDEVAGMLISFIGVPCDLRFIAIGFFLFRLFDTVKPYPADRLQRFKGSLGIMSDDIMAGLYTNIVLQLVLRYASFKTS